MQVLLFWDEKEEMIHERLQIMRRHQSTDVVSSYKSLSKVFELEKVFSHHFKLSVWLGFFVLLFPMLLLLAVR
jgi:hypothetical protein